MEAPEGHRVRVGAQNSVITAKSVVKSESLGDVGEERSVTLPSDEKDEDDKRSHALGDEEEEAEEEASPRTVDKMKEAWRRGEAWHRTARRRCRCASTSQSQLDPQNERWHTAGW